MSEFTHVTIIKEANIYFEGRVTSRSILFPDGTKKTLGVMLPGEYEFNTDKKEIMEIMSGELEVQLPGSDQWKKVEGGEFFEVNGRAKFGLRVKKITDYCCSFVD
jgi:hypothetical protein